MRIKILTFISLFLLSTSIALAKEARPMAENPELEKQAMEIAEELRCLVCQNQTIAGSDAGLAKDLRREVRTMLRDGKTKEDILDFMVQRYGDFVLYRPPVKSTTYALWAGPAVLMILGLSILMFNLKNRKKLVDESHLSEDQAKKIDELLNQDESETPGQKQENKEGES